MKISMDHLFLAPREELWNLLLNPAVLANCIPGCEQMQEAGLDSYTATLKVGVAAVKGTYIGHVRIGEKQAPSGYKLLVEGSGALGFVKGHASLGLAEEAERQTRLSLDGEAQVGGRIGSVGQRFLSGIARQLIGSFFRNIEKELLAGELTASGILPDNPAEPLNG